MTRAAPPTHLPRLATLLAVAFSTAQCGGEPSSSTSSATGDGSTAGTTAETPTGTTLDTPTGPGSGSEDGASESSESGGGPGACAPTCTPVASSTVLAPLDCMATGWAADALAVPSLPFHQPAAQPADLAEVVTSALPASNRYQVAFGWNGPAPIVPIASWKVDEFTKLGVPDPVADWQRGQADAYGRSAAQVIGTRVGLWANTMDPGGVSYAGSASLNTGCWYQGPPFARMFPTAEHVFDVAFIASVPFDGSVGNAHGQAYFQLIALDRSGGCGDHCAFSFSVGFYSKFPANASAIGVIGDATGTLGTLPLAGAGLDAAQWIVRAPESMGYQTTTFGRSPVHFRIRAADLLAIRDAVAVFSESHAQLSTNPTDYGVSLLNVNGETYDPCQDPTHIAPCGGNDHAQLAWTVEDFHVTSFVDHQAAGAPAATAAANGTGAQVLYRTALGTLDAFTDQANTGAFAHTTLAASDLAGAPNVLAATADTPAAALYRDVSGHVHARALDDVGEDIDLQALTGAPAAASDPEGFVAPDGARHVVYRDLDGVVRSLVANGSAWQVNDLAAQVGTLPLADGAPMGYAADCGWHIVYRDIDKRIRIVVIGPDGASTTDTAAIPGATDDAYSDPQGFAGPDGAAHVVYRDIIGKIHELVHADGAWTHTEISTAAAAAPALGSPSGQLAGCTPRIAYVDVDHTVHLMTQTAGTWTDRSFVDVRGAVSSSDDPTLFIDAQGVTRIAYRGGDGRLRELYETKTGWLAREM